jgi:hypothetical protein
MPAETAAVLARDVPVPTEPVAGRAQLHPCPYRRACCQRHLASPCILPRPAWPQGKNVLRKEPMSKDVNEGDVFSVNDAFASKLYKVKIGMVAAQVRRKEK